MGTTIETNSKNAAKLFNAALFVEAIKAPSWSNMLTGKAPKITDATRKTKGQTDPGAPIVRITDLEAKAGDEVSVDMFHHFSQKPVMGDAKLAGKGAKMSFAADTLRINQGRTVVESGGRMSQQRTSHDLKKLAKTMIGNSWFSRLDDQISLVHLAGARGDDVTADWIVPVASDPDFADIMVNSVTPPTFDRHLYGGDATAIDNIDSADKMSLAAIDRLRLVLDEMAFPPQPIMLEGDEQAGDNPFYLLSITSRQWHDLTTSADGATIRQLQANAMERARGFNHPVFRGDVLFWNGILVRKVRRPIVFNAGSNVTVCTNSADAATTTKTAGVRINRALLLGAQALGTAYGNVLRAGSGGADYFRYHEEMTDHENVVEHSIAWMNGKKKLRFRGSDGRVNDHGVVALDTAVSTN